MSPFLSGARSQPCNHGHRADRVTSESDTAAIAYGRCALNKASVVFSFRVLLAQRATEQRILGFMAKHRKLTDLEKAREIVARYGTFNGSMGANESIVRAVAEGIALGRNEGIAMAAELVGAALKTVTDT